VQTFLLETLPVSATVHSFKSEKKNYKLNYSRRKYFSFLILILTQGFIIMADVSQQIRAMVMFINQEAQEKAEEIKLNAERTARNDTATFIHNEKLRLNIEYEKKTEDVKQQKKIKQSEVQRKGLLKLLADREKLVNQLKETTMEELRKSQAKADEYKRFLLNSTVEAALVIDEAKVFVKCTPEDKGILQQNMEAIEEMYKHCSNEKSFKGKHKEVKFTLNTNQFLSRKEKIGGVVVTALNSRIIVDNTIAARLGIVIHDQLPQLNRMLFPKVK
jgi:V-type H+-transporting ATPase subunit E